MLSCLQIRNFAIIDRVDIEFASGMTVLTGETGAGKSILVDALGLVLGERGGTGLVRTGARRAEFTAEFDIRNHSLARAWLEEQALDMDDECLLRRVINADGRSRAFINGNAVPLQALKSLGEFLLDIHGQHFHQSLSKRAVQRDLLDYFGGTSELRDATAAACAEWQSIATRLKELQSAEADRSSRLEFLSFQLAELDALDLEDGELASLQAERERLRHAGKLVDGVASAMSSLYEGEPGNAQHLLAEASQAIEGLVEIDEQLRPVLQMLNEASIQVTEANETLRRYAESLDMDPARRDAIEERLDAIQSVARKHRVDAAGLAECQDQLRVQFDELERAEEISAELVAASAAAESRYREIATGLSRRRHAAAAEFSGAVTTAMSDLGMPGGRFSIDVSTPADAEPRAAGLDEIEFLMSANPGQSVMPLRKVASGGELSRMSLAIQVIASGGSTIPTMVFDEVDSGVGGGVAEMVGLRLRDLGASRQVLCVTHLPQVAGLADNHFRVVKVSDGSSTRTGINRLTDDERVEELARMLGGVEITKKTRDHAAEMLQTRDSKPRRSGTAP